MRPCFLGMDFGTGGAKACLVDTAGTVMSYGYREFPIITEHPGWSEHEAAEYWPAACGLVREVLVRAGVRGDEVQGVAVSSALPSMVLVDEQGEPVHRGYNLMDRRATAEVQWLKEHIGDDRIFDLSGYRIEDQPLLVSLLWEKRNRPRAFSRVRKALTVDGYVTLRLTGRAVAHYSGAAFYGVAYDLRRRRFDERMLADVGIDAGLLPDLLNCTDIAGTVTAAAAEGTGLSPGTRVAAGQVDCNASWIGAGAIDEGSFQCNLGTVGNFGIVHRDLAFNFSPTGRLMINFPYTIDSERTYVTVPTTMTGGQCIRWIRDRFGPAEQESERVAGLNAYDRLNHEAAEVPPGAEGLVVLPFLMGERTPLWDPLARGVVFGLSLNHGRGHLVRAMMEGVAFAMYDSYRLVREAGLPLRYPMVMNEGGATSPLWRQIIADVFDVPNVLDANRAGAPYGDAVLAGVACGAFPDFSVVKGWVRTVEPIEPDPGRHTRYQELFRLYRRLYDHLKEDFQELARLRGGAA
jgi:xylulokinase